CYTATVPRPRVYDQDHILDAVERLAVQSGPAAVTIRAISDAIGVSNGAVYHTFGSRAGLVGRAWLRAGHRFRDAQSHLIDAAPASTTQTHGNDCAPQCAPCWPSGHLRQDAEPNRKGN